MTPACATRVTPAGAMAADLVKQLKAAKSVLAQIGKKSDAYKEIAEAQSAMAMAIMAPWAFISAEDSAMLVLEIGQMPFGKRALATLLGRVTTLATASAQMLAANAAASAELAGSGRTPMQDFSSILAYLTKRQWDKILDERNDFMGRVAVVLQACKSLGWRTLHEPTVQLAACVALLVDGFDWTMRMCPMAQWGYFKRAKTYAKKLLPWKLCKQLAATEPSFVSELPADPTDMPKVHPEWYSRAYGGGGEAPANECPLDRTMLMVLCDAVPMRESKARLKATSDGNRSSVDMALQLAERAMTMQGGGRQGARDGVPCRRYTPQPIAPATDGAIPIGDTESAPPPTTHSVEEARDKIFAKLGGKQCLPDVAKTPPSEDESEGSDGGDSDNKSTDGVEEAEPPPPMKKKRKAAGDGHPAPPKAKANAKRKNKKKKKTEAEHVGAKGVKKPPKPAYAVEWSRNQVMCRTGMKGPGQSTAIKFSDHGGSSDKAIAAAKKWVRKQEKKLGIHT